MSPGALAALAIWLAGIAVICRNQPLGPPALGGALALAAAALVGLLS